MMAQQPRSLRTETHTTKDVDWEGAYKADLPRIYNFMRYRVGDDKVAEDLTAETFEKAWRNRQRYRRDLAAFSTWLFTIARHVAIDYFRKPHQEVDMEGTMPVDTNESMDDLVQKHSDYERFTSLISELSGRDRELVALKYGAGLTNRAIASLSGISETNVGTILHRITQQLRTELEEEYGG